MEYRNGSVIWEKDRRASANTPTSGSRRHQSTSSRPSPWRGQDFDRSPIEGDEFCRAQKEELS
ncbi:MAG: hypothetical protein J0H21_02210, partial [Rhizobiales bacterium]|nr:hypothetical protein [Hyphomicrobiales bacterium]